MSIYQQKYVQMIHTVFTTHFNSIDNVLGSVNVCMYVRCMYRKCALSTNRAISITHNRTVCNFQLRLP